MGKGASINESFADYVGFWLDFHTKMVLCEMKTCLLAITGSVAACKTPELVRRLQQQGFDVHSVVTESGSQFVAPAALAAISGNTVLSNRFFETQTKPGILAEPDYSHLEWAKKADLILVAPASADSIARIASGRADGVFEAAVLAAKCPVLIAPAMNTAMLEAKATQANLSTLRSRGIDILPTEVGTLACGDSGAGRLLPVDEIALFAKRAVTKPSLQGKKVMITLGGTREYLDPVRFVGNASSGRMGLALALEAFRRGGDVSLVVGAVDIALPAIFSTIECVTSAEEMLQVAQKSFAKTDIAVFAAAVADFAPDKSSSAKLSSQSIPTLKLRQTPDIAAELGKAKHKGQISLGFALETAAAKSALTHAEAKMHRKNFDAIFVNSDTALGNNVTSGTLICGHKRDELSGSKDEVAASLWNAIEEIETTTKKARKKS